MIKTYKVMDKIGLHARPASLLVDAASKYPNEISIIYKQKKITLKSILAVMSLGVPYGEDISIEVEGDNPEEIFITLEKVLVENQVV
ncbi:MAG: HPr family phosphocarrier protein [Sphaerochaetaceae bacterium]|nr:HPr family phosphocarrier protein [Sphaerochaetaceae bacterium]